MHRKGKNLFLSLISSVWQSIFQKIINNNDQKHLNGKTILRVDGYTTLNLRLCFDVNLQGFCLISVRMQSQKNSLIHQKLFFLVQGKISPSSLSQTISGELKIMDSSNLSIIDGSFFNGFCPSAKIFTLNSSIIGNISVQIKSDGSVYMGGCSVEEIQMVQIQFYGRYRGYQRYGYGRTQEMVNGRYYEQHSLWDCTKEMGTIIRQHRDNEDKVSNMVITYDDGEQMEECVTSFKNGRYGRKVEKKDGKQKQEQISKEQFQRFIQEGLKIKQKMIDTYKQANFICPLKEHPLKWMRYDLQALDAAKKSRLSYDICEVYIQYLFCSQQNHQRGSKAILSLSLADYLYQSNQKRAVEERISWLMHPFNKRYNILGGFWKKIIIPLVLTNMNKHFSFAVIEFDPILCTFYDSASYKHTKIYQKLIKYFLIQQASAIDRETDDIDKMKFEISLDFPKQADDVSCGYFMLQGIQDIMKHDQITFKSENLPVIKSKILKKLQGWALM